MERKVIISLDVSKSTLDCVILETRLDWSSVSKLPVRRIANSSSSIEDFAIKFKAGTCIFALEPTGSYSDKALETLTDLGHHVCLVGTRMFNSYCQFLGIINKHDQQAARTLAHIAQVAELPRYEPPSKLIKTRRKLFSALEALQKDHQRLKNRIHAEEQYKNPSELILKAFEDTRDLIEQKINSFQEQLNQLKDEQFEELKNLAQSVPGIGQITADLLITLTNGFKNFQEAKQVVKFCGLAPGSHKSGSSVNLKKRVSKQANANLRRALYMAAMVACRYNQPCKELYNRLRAKGKGHYKAMVAVMAKLVRQVFAVVKTKSQFDNQYQTKFKKNDDLISSLAN